MNSCLYVKENLDFMLQKLKFNYLQQAKEDQKCIWYDGSSIFNIVKCML